MISQRFATSKDEEHQSPVWPYYSGFGVGEATVRQGIKLRSPSIVDRRQLTYPPVFFSANARFLSRLRGPADRMLPGATRWMSERKGTVYSAYTCGKLCSLSQQRFPASGKITWINTRDSFFPFSVYDVFIIQYTDIRYA